MANLGLLSFVATNEGKIETENFNNKINYSSNKEYMITVITDDVEIFCTKDKSTKLGICKEYISGLEKKSFLHNNAIPNGTKIEMYDEDEAIKFTVGYKNGVYNGITQYFRENGTLYSSGKVIDGKMQGPCSVYNEQGVKVKDIHYYNDSIYMINEYYTSGELKDTYDILYNVCHGVFLSFYKNGNIRSKSYYVNNKIHGLEQNFSEFGNLLSEVNYFEGVKHGSCSYYDSMGDLIDIYLYQNDKIVKF
jgi:antitoxin component YwqK of YwqJK toxin-antitoxin module